ncbi:OLC1v1014197C1 [Oldenlandia corymbosa var. corymbosa]|uniref:OLC1v1014197C1 n=1 Tax=Oldenlandia corymbosa var. corymbosa TaxID=529605 RepID=A0AAV1E2N0_OLDCO|nr:OLC1v1014197C1 [Oldenlandia corymbosa var. corymbosa]
MLIKVIYFLPRMFVWCFQKDDYVVVEKGTTTLGFVFNNDGVMVAVDHDSRKLVDGRLSMSLGAIPENVCVLDSHLFATLSGGDSILCETLLGRFQQLVI